jgi:hypothetical protein
MRSRLRLSYRLRQHGGGWADVDGGDGRGHA